MEHLCVCWFRAAVVLAEGHTKGSQDPRDSSSYTLSQVSPSTSKTSWKGRWKKKGVEGDPSSVLLLCVAATVYAPIDVALFFSDCRWLDGDEEKHLTSVIYTRYSTYIEKDIPQMLFIQEEDSAAVVLECHLAYAWIIPVLVDSICHVDNSWVSLQCVHIAQENIVTFHMSLHIWRRERVAMLMRESYCHLASQLLMISAKCRALFSRLPFTHTSHGTIETLMFALLYLIYSLTHTQTQKRASNRL
jgi:hypothetical protein